MAHAKWQNPISEDIDPELEGIRAPIEKHSQY